jgi:chromosome segregation ATPase
MGSLLRGKEEIKDRERLKKEHEAKIAALEEAALLKEENFASRKEEAADKTKKLKKMFSKYQTAKQDLDEHAQTVQREKEDMLDSIRLLKQQLKLKNTVIDAFIPPEVRLYKFSEAPGLFNP